MTDATLDGFDIRLLAALQQDGRASLFALAERIGLSASQLGRRLKRLEEAGGITGYAARLEPEAGRVGFGGPFPICLGRPFAPGPRRVPADLKAYSQFLLDNVMPLPGVRQVRSSIVLRPIKRSSALPLDRLRLQG